MPHYDEPLSLDWFSRPGAVKISPAALEMAREFHAELVRTRPGEDWLVCFDWADSRRARIPRDSNQWVDLGAGLDLTAYEREKVPRAAIQNIGGLEILVKISELVLSSSAGRSIEIDEQVRTHLALR